MALFELDRRERHMMAERTDILLDYPDPPVDPDPLVTPPEPTEPGPLPEPIDPDPLQPDIPEVPPVPM